MNHSIKPLTDKVNNIGSPETQGPGFHLDVLWPKAKPSQHSPMASLYLHVCCCSVRSGSVAFWGFKLRLLLSSLCGLTSHIVLLGGTNVSRVNWGHGVCVWSARVFGQMVCVKCHPHDCQDPGCPSRILHCSWSSMFLSFTVTGFNVVVDHHETAGTLYAHP